jgi:segregation and condensation protein A
MRGTDGKRHVAMTYRVDLEIYNGPMDLLLYLIRKEEVDIRDIPIVRITDQYLAYLGLLEALDINVAGDFLVMAATLLEIKSRVLLPRPALPSEEGEAEPEGDPRLELIQQLLAYKRFRDAADELVALGDEQLRRFSRPPAEVVIGPDDQRYALDEMMKGVQLWDLLSAFARVMRSISLSAREVIYDETPIEDVAERLLGLLAARKTALFTDLLLEVFAGFEQLSRGHVVSTFLAVLECIRQRLIAVEQDKEAGDLRVFLREERPEVTQMRKSAPPEAFITSREAARQAAGFEQPDGRLAENIEELRATEFDEALDSIVIPEVEQHKPLYCDEEVLGRAEAAEGEAPVNGPVTAGGAAPTEGRAEAAGETASPEASSAGESPTPPEEPELRPADEHPAEPPDG